MEIDSVISMKVDILLCPYTDIAVTKNILVGKNLDVYGSTITTSIEPRETERYDSGSLTRRWNTVRTKTLIADTLVGSLAGNIIGNATTATNLRFPTTFRMQGDICRSYISLHFKCCWKTQISCCCSITNNVSF